MRLLFVIFIVLISALYVHGQAPGCPNVTISAPGASGGQLTLACNQNVTLTANVFHTGTTNTYTVSSIPYAPPYAFNTGTPILVNQDDIWSGIINLPFTFCFFGNAYNRIVAGSNGVVSFDLSYANQFCAWSFSASIPSTSLFRNTIFGPYHDIDPAVSGTMYYAILGSYPCRTFVVNWHNVAMYSSSCNNLKATHQIVIYETTNVIEVYIQNAPLCASWNNGNKVIGIQNSTGTVGFTPPGRNTGAWQTSNEAWRFTPNGPQNYTLQWFQGNVPIGTTTSINVCPTSSPTTYKAIVTYDNCDMSQVVVQDQLTITLAGLDVTAQASPSTICEGSSSQLQVNFSGSGSACVPNTFSYQWSPVASLSSPTDPSPVATPSTTTQYTVTVSHNNLNCSGSASVTVVVEDPPVLTTSAQPPQICSGSQSTISVSGAQQYNWAGLGPGASHVVTPTTTTTYTVTGTSTNGCTNTADVTVTVYPSHQINILASKNEICNGDSVILWLDNPVNPVWSTGQGADVITVKPTHTSTYSVIDINQYGCIDSSQITIFVHQNPIVDFTATQTSGCPPFTSIFHPIVLSEDPIAHYLWSVQAHGTSTSQNPQYHFQVSGMYDVSLNVKTIYDCAASIIKSQYIHVYPIPSVNFTYSPQYPEVEIPLQFTDLTSGASQWEWDFGDGHTSNENSPIHTYYSAGEYIVTLYVVNNFGCDAEVSQTIFVRDITTLYMPNAFSPDANGLNDFFGPKGMNIERMKFYIYNRWGQLVFYSEDLNRLWDGRVNGELPARGDVFTWKLEVKLIDGFEKHLAGQVVIIR